MTPKAKRGLVGIIANDSARYSLFASCVTALQVPPGWEIQWLIGGDWCGARNDLCRFTLEEGYSHLWFMDDDHAFSPDLLTRLLKWDVALVNPMCLTRVAPFSPVTYTTRDDSAEHRYFPIGLESQPDSGIVMLEAAGCAGMLIRRDVLEALDPPWFEYGDRSEDIVFCEKARAAGFELWGDLGARLGHITTAVVIPDFVDGDWHTRLEIGHGFQVFTPPATSWADPNKDDNPHPDELPEEDYYIKGDDQTSPGPAPSEGSREEERTGAAPTPPPIAVPDPCLICGEQSTWRDAHGQQGCEEHHPEHPAWLGYYERAEVWFVPEEDRWYGRLLNGDGQIALLLHGLHESELVSRIEAEYPGVAVHFIENELADSRKARMGPPSRLWDRQPRGV